MKLSTTIAAVSVATLAFLSTGVTRVLFSDIQLPKINQLLHQLFQPHPPQASGLSAALRYQRQLEVWVKN